MNFQMTIFFVQKMFIQVITFSWVLMCVFFSFDFLSILLTFHNSVFNLKLPKFPSSWYMRIDLRHLRRDDERCWMRVRKCDSSFLSSIFKHKPELNVHLNVLYFFKCFKYVNHQIQEWHILNHKFRYACVLCCCDVSIYTSIRNCSHKIPLVRYW